MIARATCGIASIAGVLSVGPLPSPLTRTESTKNACKGGYLWYGLCCIIGHDTFYRLSCELQCSTSVLRLLDKHVTFHKYIAYMICLQTGKVTWLPLLMMIIQLVRDQSA
jgi:hypothetical protein